jgi:hypothetical protein
MITRAAPLSAGSPADEELAIAIIVNTANTAPDPSLEELRAIFTLDRQFWPDGQRIALLLPSTTAPQRRVLLTRVYDMSDADLRKYWVAKLFRGAIPAIPTTMRSPDALAAAIQTSSHAITAVPASEVPPGVRVLKVAGKTPMDRGYPLVEPATP